jgi:TIR domain
VRELDRRALHAWYDKREILVGDSIVGRINEALAQARFLVVVLSPRSVIKPWVTRELNSTLMRQLDQQHIAILPVLVEDCSVPPLLADFNYADFRHSFDDGMAALVAAIRRKRQ